MNAGDVLVWCAEHGYADDRGTARFLDNTRPDVLTAWRADPTLATQWTLGMLEGKALRSWRACHPTPSSRDGMTQEELGLLLGVSTKTIVVWENGSQSPVSWTMVWLAIKGRMFTHTPTRLRTGATVDWCPCTACYRRRSRHAKRARAD